MKECCLFIEYFVIAKVLNTLNVNPTYKGTYIQEPLTFRSLHASITGLKLVRKFEVSLYLQSTK